jgi:ribosomal protein S18 acetylase RimI-like enzyme
MIIDKTTIKLDSTIDRIQFEEVTKMLSQSYWSPGITRAEIEKGARNSALVVGAYLPDGKQIGYLRVVSDKVRFAYILDVIVHADCRRQGIGQKMVHYALSHDELKDVYQWLLITQDAHGVYQKCGFQKLANPELWMTIRNPRPDRRVYKD